MELPEGYTLYNKDLINFGRHSRVFLGATKTGKKVAVKVYKNYKVYNREISILKQLHNKANVPDILNYRSMEIVHYMIMPKYEISLHDIIRKHGNLNVVEGLFLLHELVVCLEEIHSENIVHRDIKPMNIMLHGNRMIIIDFSLSIHQEHTLRSTVVGSPIFMSIKAHKDELKKYTYHDDLESTFYTFIYCINGVLPWSFIPTSMSKTKAMEEIHFQKTIYKSSYSDLEFLCRTGDHADILLEIEELLKTNHSTFLMAKENFYEKIYAKK